MSRGIKKENQYIHLFNNYHNIPKAVFAAICASFILKMNNEDFGTIEAEFQGEWETLYVNNIIPQKPRTKINIQLS